MKKLAVFALSLALALSMAACGILSGAEKLQEYDFGPDKVPTVNSEVGERTVTAVDTGTNNGSPYKQYTYKSDSVKGDLTAYTLKLRDSGWQVTQAYNLNEPTGKAQLGAISADSGKILVLSIAYDESQYAVKITKFEGTLE